MKRKIAYFASLILMLAPVGAAAQDFSADTATYDPSGRTLRGKLYRASNMLRAESAPRSQNATDPMILIVDLETQVSYTISNRQKMIMVSHGRAAVSTAGIAIPTPENPCASVSGPQAANASCNRLGEETVNGRHTVKWELTETINGHSGTQYVWVDPKLRGIVKMQYGSGIIELQNIQEGPQPASLFLVPTGYRQIDVGGR